MSEKSLLEIDLAGLSDRQFFPSPAAWEDQVLYFLMLDRFSDGNEQGYRGNNRRRVRRGTTPQFQPTDAENAFGTPEAAECWREAGAHWVGGTPPYGSVPSSSRLPFTIPTTAMGFTISSRSTRISAHVQTWYKWWKRLIEPASM
jgi:hypothetical protein